MYFIICGCFVEVKFVIFDEIALGKNRIRICLVKFLYKDFPTDIGQHYDPFMNKNKLSK